MSCKHEDPQHPPIVGAVIVIPALGKTETEKPWIEKPMETDQLNFGSVNTKKAIKKVTQSQVEASTAQPCICVPTDMHKYTHTYHTRVHTQCKVLATPVSPV